MTASRPLASSSTWRTSRTPKRSCSVDIDALQKEVSLCMLLDIPGSCSGNRTSDLSLSQGLAEIRKKCTPLAPILYEDETGM